MLTLLAVCACLALPGSLCAFTSPSGTIGGLSRPTKTLQPPALVRHDMALSRAVARSAPIRQDDDDSRSDDNEVRGADLPTYYLIRENGQLVPYFDIPFEDFERIYRLYRGIDEDDRPSPFSIDQISVVGKAEGDLAELTVDFSIRANQDGWIRIPLRLDRCTLRAPQSSADETVAFLSVEEDGQGLVCWIQGTTGEVTHLSLDVVRSIDPNSGGRRLAFDLPPSAFSQLTLDVPRPDAVGSPNDESILEETSYPMSGWTRFSVLGRSGGFDFAWMDQATGMMEERRFVATSRTNIVVENATQLVMTALLDIDSGGRRIDELDILLPRGAVLLPTSPLDYVLESLGVEVGGGTDSSNAGRERIRVRWISDASQIVNIRIPMRLNLDDVSMDGFRPVEPIHVVDAIQHTGRIDLYSAGREWIVDWRPEGSINRTNVPAGDGNQGIPVAGFSFLDQACALAIRGERQPTQIDVEPVVELSVTRNNVQLIGHYRFDLSGSPANRIRFKMSRWELDSTSSRRRGVSGDLVPMADPPADEEIIRSVERDPDDAGYMILHLNPGALEDNRSFILRLVAHLPLESGVRQIQLPIPLPDEAVIASTTLLVRQEESLVIQPDRTALQNVPNAALPEWYRPEEGAPPDATYRGLVSVDQSEVPFAISVRPRSVSYRTSIQPRLIDQSVNVKTEIVLDVKYQPLRELSLLIPASLLADADMIVRHESQEWIWTLADIDQASGDSLAAVTMEFDDGLIGRRLLTIEYQMPLRMIDVPTGGDNPITEKEIEIPLVQPLIPRTPVPVGVFPWPMVGPVEMLRSILEDRLQHRFVEAVITHPITLDLQPSDEKWDRLDIRENGAQLVSTFSSSQPHPDGLLRFKIRDVVHRDAYLVTLEKCWLQTHLTSNDRQDRAVFQFRTEQPRIRIRLPVGAFFNRAAIDNQAVRNPRVEEIDGRTYVSLSTPAGNADANHTIELWYRFQDRPQTTWPFTLEWPQIEGVKWVDRAYWQLIVPRGEHLAWSDGLFAAEHDWRFGPFLFERQSRMTQRELEDWMGVVNQVDATRGSNTYLFSSFGEVENCDVAFVNRRMMLLIVCSVTFILGAVIVYFRALRNPLIVASLGAAVVLFAWIQFELSILVAQVALVTALFVAAVGLIKLMFKTPEPLAPSEDVQQVDVASAVTRAMSSGALQDHADREEQPLVVSSSHADTS